MSKGILFDLDGTLVDTSGDFAAVVNGIRARRARPTVARAEVAVLVNQGALGLTCCAFEIDRDAPEFADCKQVLLEDYLASIGQHSHLPPALRQWLASDQAQRWGLVTNKPRRFTEALMRRLSLAPHCLVCGDDVRQPKPHPESLLLAARQLALPPGACLYAGDHARDIAAGRAAGMHTIAACYGFLGPGERPELWGADQLAHSPEQLVAHIDAFCRD